ncbi:unnamed protein product [Blepharisma stoltei]|uniref:Glutathione S-transferase n=1 Tax=Blepharisma stoltei TaxID=1481888 RepID=A0AAU9IWC7_9CILI|nr:unnamed protein product [Blepharisma stoltei]
MALIRFHYFDGFWNGEVSRMILKHLGLPFEDIRHSHESWGKLKSSGVPEFGQLPMLEIDSHTLVQSRAIEKYLLRRAGLLTNDLYKAYQSESIVGFIDDLKSELAKVVFDENKEKVVRWNNEKLPGKIQKLERRLNQNNSHIVGDEISHADFVVFQWTYDYFLRKNKVATMRPVLEGSSPRLLRYCESFKRSSPNLSAYLDSRVDDKPF